MNIENKSKQYKTNGSFIYSCQFHVIFTTKYRRNVLVDSVATRLKDIILHMFAENKDKIIEIEVMPDHVHLILDVDPTNDGVCKAVRQIKGKTSNVLRKEFPHLRSRIPSLWTRSKFISSVGSVSLEVVKAYIESQKNR